MKLAEALEGINLGGLSPGHRRWIEQKLDGDCKYLSPTELRMVNNLRKAADKSEMDP
jgi:hypothetical protein